MTSPPRDGAEGADGFGVYDELAGPVLDPGRWSVAHVPLPNGGEHLALDPHAEVSVGSGELRVTIPRFSLSDDRFQAADSVKYLVLPSRQFELPHDRAATFAVDLAVATHAQTSDDFRRGIAAFHVLDLGGSQRVYSVCGTPPGCWPCTSSWAWRLTRDAPPSSM